MRMTNLTPVELQLLNVNLHSYIALSCNVRRGERSEFNSLNVLFLTLTTMNYDGCWNDLADMFQVKAPTFLHLATSFK